jgi:hypothetical protein
MDTVPQAGFPQDTHREGGTVLRTCTPLRACQEEGWVQSHRQVLRRQIDTEGWIVLRTCTPLGRLRRRDGHDASLSTNPQEHTQEGWTVPGHRGAGLTGLLGLGWEHNQVPGRHQAA